MADPRWGTLAPLLAARPPEEWLELLRALCERSAENRRFVGARLRGDDPVAAQAEHRDRVLAEFAAAPARMPRFGIVRREIRDYRKASSDLSGTAELMLLSLEAGTQLGREHEDMGEAYFTSLGLVLRDLVALGRDAPAVLAEVLPRLRALADVSRRVGWTWGEVVRAALAELDPGTPIS